MQDYKELCKELIEDHITDVMAWDKEATRKSVLQGMLDNGNEDVFGNLSGSRTYSTHEAQQFIDKSGAIWDEDIKELLDSVSDDYFAETLSKGAETLDVVILELLSNQVISEMLENE